LNNPSAKSIAGIMAISVLRLIAPSSCELLNHCPALTDVSARNQSSGNKLIEIIDTKIENESLVALSLQKHLVWAMLTTARKDPPSNLLKFIFVLFWIEELRSFKAL
jgi:hypothetical protein